MSVSIGVIERMGLPDFLVFHANVRREQDSTNTKRRAAAEAALKLVESLSNENRVKIAFRGKRVSVKEKRLIEVLDANPGATSAELARAMAWKGNTSWHLRFGTMCRDRLAPLVEPPISPEPGTEDETVPFYSGILAAYDEASHGFTLHAPVREALVDAGVLEARPAD